MRRVRWLASGREVDPNAAFDWISGRVGSRQNPDGMRSVLHAAVALAFLCALVDLWLLWRHDWAEWALFSFLHLAWVGAFTVGTVLNVGFLETIDGRPLHRLGGPNVLTLARAFLAPPLAYLLAMRDFRAAFVCYAVVIGTDVIDGWWARRYDLRSKLGIVLDPVIDLFFHLCAFVSMALVGVLGRWALVLILVRSGLLLVGTAILYFGKGRVRIQPTPLGKGTGLLLAVATSLLLALVAFLPERASGIIALLRQGVTILLGISVVHAVAIGVINLGWRYRARQRGGRRPAPRRR